MKFIHWIEYNDGNYLSIGMKSPRQNKIQLKVPLWIAKFF